jgi:selenium-binding protein 1
MIEWLCLPGSGDICMYDVSDPEHPRLADRLFLGGSIAAGTGVTVAPASLAQLGLTEQPKKAVVKGVEVQGGPQMLQLRCVWGGGDEGTGALKLST